MSAPQRFRRTSGDHHFAQPGHQQITAGQTRGATTLGNFNLDIEPITGTDSNRDRQFDNHHRDLGTVQQPLGVFDIRFAHLVDKLLALPRRRRVGPGVVQPDDKAHTLDLHLAPAYHEREIADGFLNLGRRRLLPLLLAGTGTHLNECQRRDRDQGSLSPGTPGECTPH